MEIINNKKIAVSTSEELKEVLENDNNYEFIYLMDNITLTSGIKINENKQKIVIDGTYNNNRYTLTDALVFKKLDDEIIILNEIPTLVFTGTNNENSKKTLITWSKEKGPLLDLTNDALEVNEEYFAEVIFVLEE